MGVKVKGFDKFMKDMRSEADRVVKDFIEQLDYLGLQAVAYIRDRSGDKSWYDQTGALRSSIGYVLVYNGSVIGESGFEPVRGANSRISQPKNGSKEGRDYAHELAKNYPSGYALIVVAGMDYASLVEAMDNKDVLASGSILLKREVERLVSKYK